MASQRAIWARVSTDEQESGNQVPELRQCAARCGREIAAEYVVDGAGHPAAFISGDTGITSLTRLAKR